MTGTPSCSPVTAGTWTGTVTREPRSVRPAGPGTCTCTCCCSTIPATATATTSTAIPSTTSGATCGRRRCRRTTRTGGVHRNSKDRRQGRQPVPPGLPGHHPLRPEAALPGRVPDARPGGSRLQRRGHRAVRGLRAPQPDPRSGGGEACRGLRTAPPDRTARRTGGRGAATPGRPVGRKLPGGLHVAALKRPTHLALTAWRTANRLPSARECEILARDTGMLLPKISTFERQDGVLAFSVVDRASSPDQCDHRLGSPLHGDGRNESFWSWTCLTCGMTTTRLQARRGSRTRFEYGDQEVSETAWTILTVRGPRPWKELRQVRADLTASLTASAGARRESSGLAEPRPAPLPGRQVQRPPR